MDNKVFAVALLLVVLHRTPFTAKVKDCHTLAHIVFF